MNALQRLSALNTRMTQFAYGDRIIGQLRRQGAGPSSIERTLKQRYQLARTMRAVRNDVRPSEVGGVVARNRIAARAALGRNSAIFDSPLDSAIARAYRE